MIERIKEEAIKFHSGLKGSHDFSHTERVLKLALQIGEKENADLEIIRVAVLLHDIGRKAEDDSKGKVCHAEESAKLARQLLQELKFEEDKINKIVHCIETHRFRNNKKPETKEAKVLFDADKLDSIGAVGVGRAFLFAGEIDATLHNKEKDIMKTEAYGVDDTAYREYMFKLKYVKNRMLTEEGRRIAEERHKFMEDFFNRLNEEVDGLR